MIDCSISAVIAVTGNLFFVPSATFLENVTEDQDSGDLNNEDQPAIADSSSAPVEATNHLHRTRRQATVHSASVPSKEKDILAHE